MFKNVGGQNLAFLALDKTTGDPVDGLSPSVMYSKDGQTPLGFGVGAITNHGQGVYDYAPVDTETNADHVVFVFSSPTIITQIVNVYPIDPAIYKADVSGLSTQVELDKVLKVGEAATYASDLGSKSVTYTRD